MLGEEFAYRITVANADRIPLATASLDVRLPSDFTVTTADPTPDDARGFRWTIGTIRAEETRTFTIRGRLYGKPESSARIETVAVYRPANFNADFQTTASATTTLDSSPVELTLTGPENAVPNASVTYTIAYAYAGTLTTPPAIIALDVPRTFVFASATPERTSSDALLWRIATLEPGAKGTIAVTGSFTAGQREPVAIRASVAIEPAPDRRVELHAQEVQTPVLGGDAILIATVNDQTSGFSVAPGDTLRFRLTLRNDGKDDLRDLRVHAIFEATAVTERSILNFSAMTDPANGTAIGEQLAPGLRRGTITWMPKDAPELAALTPGTMRQLDVAIPLHTAASLPGFPAQGRITFTGAMDIGSTGAIAKPRRITTAPITLQVASL